MRQNQSVGDTDPIQHVSTTSLGDILPTSDSEHTITKDTSRNLTSSHESRHAPSHPSDGQRETPWLADTDVFSDIAALSRLLVAPLPPMEAFASALTIANRLLSAPTALRVYALQPSAYANTLRLLPFDSATVQDVTSLGYGAGVDQQVLIERQTLRRGGLLCLPLVSSADALLGAMVVESADVSAHMPTSALVTLVADHLTALLERGASHTAVLPRENRLQALAALTFPASAADEYTPTTDEARALEQRRNTQRRHLARAQQALRVDAPAHSCLVVLALPDGARANTTTLITENTTTDVARLSWHELTAQLADVTAQSGPLMFDAASAPERWTVLLALRQALESDLGQAISRVVALSLPGTGAEQSLLLYADTQPTDTATDARTDLAHVESVLLATAAGLNHLRLVDLARTEARARDAFISLTAHELRNPLTSIKGYAQLLIRQSRKTPLSDAMLRSVESIEQQSQRMAEMVSELLDASRIRRNGFELGPAAPLDLIATTNRVIARRAAYFSQQQFRVETAEESLTIVGDVQRIEQVLRDLLDNAARHTPNGGEIIVYIGREGALARIDVRDHGVGVAPEYHERIFDYLFRTPTSESRNLSGLGLGLYVSRYLVERCGGRLWIAESRTDAPSGSVFSFTLPIE